MFRAKILFSVIVFLFVNQLCFSDAIVNIHCDEKEAVLYVNGVEKVQIKEKITSMPLPSGNYELMLSKPLDEDWQLVGRKNIVLKDDTSIDVKLGMDIEKISKKQNRSNADNFEKSADVVVDKAAKLVWQDDASVTEIKKNWDDAQVYCEALTLGHADDWRLPSYDELISIVDYNKHTLAIMPAFKHIVSEYYWSSNVDVEDTKSVKNIYFGNGCPDSKPKKNAYYIRCVRTLK